MTEMLSGTPCVNCGGAGLELHADNRLVCRFCGHTNSVAGVVCGHCERINAPGADVCDNCLRGLQQNCPACGASNLNSAEACRECGASLDSLSRLSTRWGVDPANRLNEQARAAAGIKAREAADAERRSGYFQAIEDQRQEELAASGRRQKQQQRVIMIFVTLSVLAFAIVALAALAAALLN